MIRIPVYRPTLSGNESIYVQECMNSGWISSKGKFVDLFEKKFSDYLGMRHSVSICNGTAALHVALLALGIGPGDEVIVPTLTYVASVNAIKYVGARPVFVDSEPDSWQIDPEEIRRKLTDRTKAILVVHLYGHPCDMDQIMEIAEERGIRVIEDCAEAFGSRYKGRLCGTFGDVSTFSFYGNKTITTGEGGMVVSNDDDIADMAVRFHGQGLAKDREYWHDIIGYNFRMTNICAAIGLAQLERADLIVTRKREVAEMYISQLDRRKIEFLREKEGMFSSYWMCSVLFRSPKERSMGRADLLKAGIETRPVFNPIHLMPMYEGGPDQLPVACDLASRGINLPSFPTLTSDEIEEICGILNSVHS